MFNLDCYIKDNLNNYQKCVKIYCDLLVVLASSTYKIELKIRLKNKKSVMFYYLFYKINALLTPTGSAVHLHVN